MSFAEGILVGFFAALVFALVWAGLTAVGGFLLSWAWNVAAVPLFHLPAMSFIQGVAGVVLIQVIGKLASVTVNNHGGSK